MTFQLMSDDSPTGKRLLRALPATVLVVSWTLGFGRNKAWDWYLVTGLSAAWLAFVLRLMRQRPGSATLGEDGSREMHFPLRKLLITSVVGPAPALILVWTGLKSPGLLNRVVLGGMGYVVLVLAVATGGAAKIRWTDRSICKLGLFSRCELEWSQVLRVKVLDLNVVELEAKAGTKCTISLMRDGGPQFAADALRLLPEGVLQTSPHARAVFDRAARPMDCT